MRDTWREVGFSEGGRGGYVKEKKNDNSPKMLQLQLSPVNVYKIRSRFYPILEINNIAINKSSAPCRANLNWKQ